MAEKRKSTRGTTTTKPRTSVTASSSGDDDQPSGSFGPWGVPNAPDAAEFRQLNALGLPEESPEKKSSFMKEEFGGITDRIHRALCDISTLYNDDEDKIKLEDEVGVERSHYLSRLDALNDRFTSIGEERQELLNSLRDMYTDDDLIQLEESGKVDAGVLTSLRMRMQSEEMGYQKLRDLNLQMLQMKDKSASESSDTKEANLQTKEVDRFKQMYNARKTKTVERTHGAHWKQAATEIVGLLGKIRQEGKTDINLLTKALENTEQLIAKQVQALARLEERVYDKQEEIHKYHRDNSVLENDNLLLKSEVTQYRNKIVELKKKIKELESSEKEVAKTVEEEKPQPRRSHGLPTETIPEARPDVKKRKKKHHPNADVIGIKQENENLIDKVTTLEMKVIEKETKNMIMEHDVSEMLGNIMATSPDAIGHLRRSVDLTRYLPDEEEEDEDDPAREIAISIEDRVPNHGNGTPSGRRSTPPVQATPLSPAGTRAGTRTATRAATRAGTRAGTRNDRVRTPILLIDDVTKPTKETADNNHSLLAEGPSPTIADYYRELEHKNRLTVEIDTIRKGLARAKREIVGLEFGGTRGYKVATQRSEKADHEKGMDGKTENNKERDKKNAESEIPQRAQARRGSTIQPPNVAKLLAKVSPSSATGTKPSDEKALYEQLKSQGLHKSSPRRIVRVIREKVPPTDQARGGHVNFLRAVSEGEEAREGDEVAEKEKEGTLDDEGNRVSFEEYVVVDQGLQTDPMLDPLGAWSNVQALSARNRRRSASPRRTLRKSPGPLPLPPDEWTQYDPTPIKGPHHVVMTQHAPGHAQNRGRSRPGSAAESLFFVERELSRIISGIQGFTSYVCQLLSREVLDLSENNDEIRRKLSARFLKRIERTGNDDVTEEQGETHPSKSTTTSTTKRTKLIRRDRFELSRKGKQGSSFFGNRAFASYTGGKRAVIPRSASSPDAKRPRFDSNLALPFQLANEHLLLADAEAKHRLVAELSGGKALMTSCERWNREVEMIGKYAIDVLKGTMDFFRQTVDQQMKDHRMLTEGLKMKEELESVMKGGDEDVPLKIKRSISQSSFLEPGNGFSTTGRGLLPHPSSPTAMAQSKSLSSIQSSHRYLPSLLVHQGGKPANRDKLDVPKAVVPRRGYLRLEAITTKPAKNVRGDHIAESKKPHRPTPQSHRKLVAKQTLVLRRRTRKDRQGKGGDVTTLRNVLFQLGPLQQAPTSNQTRGPPSKQKRQRMGNKAAHPEAEGAAVAVSGDRGFKRVTKTAKSQLGTDTKAVHGKYLSVFST